MIAAATIGSQLWGILELLIKASGIIKRTTTKVRKKLKSHGFAIACLLVNFVITTSKPEESDAIQAKSIYDMKIIIPKLQTSTSFVKVFLNNFLVIKRHRFRKMVEGKKFTFLCIAPCFWFPLRFQQSTQEQ